VTGVTSPKASKLERVLRNSMITKAATGHNRRVAGGRQRRDPTGGRLRQGVTVGHLPDMLVDPPYESPIHPEARGLHPLGTLMRTHVGQEEGEALSNHIN
jgi:hypothetical protein